MAYYLVSGPHSFKEVCHKKLLPDENVNNYYSWFI